MKKLFTDIGDAFRMLPGGTQGLIAIAAFAVLAISVFFAGSNYIISHRVAKLEKENVELNKTAVSALEKMDKAETQAANEGLRAKTLEYQIEQLQLQTKNQDEKILTSRKNTSSIRHDLDRVRVSVPRQDVGADELEQRLKARYGKAGDAGSGEQGP